MDKYNWLTFICKIINCRKDRKKLVKKGYFPVSLFLVAGQFSNQEITIMMNYGEKFIKELKY